jgi:hypothetical protein
MKTSTKTIHVLPTDKPSTLIKDNRGYALVTDEFTQSDLDYLKAKFQNISITSDEEIKEGDNVILKSGRLTKAELREGILGFQTIDGIAFLYFKEGDKKVTLTTDQDLIADGVQAIDEEFLEWFVKNPSCESVEIIQTNEVTELVHGAKPYYKIIIPQEEPKCTCKEHDPYCCQVHGSCLTCVKQEEPNQETLEDAAIDYSKMYFSENKKAELGFIAGAKSNAAKEYWFNKFQEQDKNKYSEEEVLELLYQHSRKF